MTGIDVNAEPAPQDQDDYTNEPTHVRVWSDGGGEWFIDGADDSRRYTEACWSYDTFPEAVADVPDFVRMTAMPGARAVTWRWDPQRKRTGIRNVPAVTE